MKLTALGKALIKTLVYYDCLDYPLRFDELKLFLFFDSNLIFNEDKLILELDKLKKTNLISYKDGFYFLRIREDDNLVELRKQSHKIVKNKIRKTIKIAERLVIIPFIRLIFISGSLALENIKKDGDLDLLVIAKFGRIWTVRFLMVLLTSLLGVRRKKNSKNVSNKICLNHFITDRSLFIPLKSIYTAQLYAHLKPLLISDIKLLDKFIEDNYWIGKYIYGWDKVKFRIKKSEIKIRQGKISYFIREILEKILNGKIGDWLERVLMIFQENRIRKNPLTYKSGGRVVVNNYCLEFHPDSPEKKIIDKYNQTMRELGFEDMADEKDSGLLK